MGSEGGRMGGRLTKRGVGGALSFGEKRREDKAQILK